MTNSSFSFLNLNVSEIQIYNINPQNGLVAYASFTLNNQFRFRNVGIHSRLDGSFRLSYPAKKFGDQNINTCYPINQETNKYITSVVIEHYLNLTKDFQDQ